MTGNIKWTVIILILLLVLSGCSLFKEPPELVIPTPIPTAPPIAAEPVAPGDVVTDPVSDIVPGTDPETAILIDAVSQQQLMAYVQTLESFGTRNSFSTTDFNDYGIGAARQWIFDEFQRVGGGRLQVEFDDFLLSYNGFSSDQSNIVATLPGTGSSDGVIVVMAHYDNRPEGDTDGYTRASGANDNASGVALLLETARIMSSREWDQTIKFVAMAAEEQGTYGSRHFAQNAFLDNMNIIGAINYDAVGGRSGIPQSVRLFADNYYQSPTGELARYYDYVTGFYLPTFPVNIQNALDREGRWGDHREFVQLGMPAIRVMESHEDPDLLNSLLDTWSLIDYSYHQKVAQLNLAFLANAAGVSEVATAPTIVPMADPGTFLLTWPVDPEIDGYAISFRPVGSADFGVFRFVRGDRAGNVVLTGYDPNTTYGVSMAAIDENGRLGMFTREIFVGPPLDPNDLTASLNQ